jgi:hypothetical protein
MHETETVRINIGIIDNHFYLRVSILLKGKRKLRIFNKKANVEQKIFTPFPTHINGAVLKHVGFFLFCNSITGVDTHTASTFCLQSFQTNLQPSMKEQLGTTVTTR